MMIAGLIGFAIFILRQMPAPEERMKYSDVLSNFEYKPSVVTIVDGEQVLGAQIVPKVSEFTFNLGSGKLTYTLRDEDKEYTYKIPHVGIFINSIEGGIELYNKDNPDDRIVYDYEPAQDNTLLYTFLPTAVMVVLMVILFMYITKQSSGLGKINQFNRMGHKSLDDNKRDTTFKDVAGADEEKLELAEIVEFLMDPEKFNNLGARIPKGVLLIGPPGTGKTLLAKAVSGEAKVRFFPLSGSDFVETFVGVGAARVRDLFEQAKKSSPSIIFIDEIDAVGRHRGAGLGGGHDEREQTLNQLLVEMDGFGTNEGVVVMAATNRHDILDPALMRPGRFDRRVFVNYPDVKGRQEILKVHAKNKPMGFDVDLKTIAKTTVGLTGADLENLLNEAALLAARRDKKAITMSDIQDSMFKVLIGPEKKSRKVVEAEKMLTAIHEAGHAIATYFCKTQDPVHHISIIPRGMAGGFTLSLPALDRHMISKTELYETIVVLLGGRIAESIILNDISTGASNDIERATEIARKMVAAYGFSDALGPIAYGKGQHEVFLGRDITSNKNVSEKVAAQIDEEIKAIIDKAMVRCKEILSSNQEKLLLLSDFLYYREKCDSQEFIEIMDEVFTREDLDKESDDNDSMTDTRLLREMLDNHELYRQRESESDIDDDEDENEEETTDQDNDQEDDTGSLFDKRF